MDDILELLQHNDDNKKFAGLLLVTRCIPSDDIDARLEVFHAVGSSFLLRLLLPLRKGRIYPRPLADDGEIEKQIHLAGLGLSVLVNLCMCKEVASCEEMRNVCVVALGTLKYGPSRLVASYLQLEESKVVIPSDVEMAMLTNCCDCISLICSERVDMIDVESFDVLAHRLEMLYEGMSDVEPGDLEWTYYESLCRCITVCLDESNIQKMKAEVLIPILSKWFAIMSSRGNHGRQTRDGYLRYHLEALQCLVHIFETKECDNKLWDDGSGWTRQIVYGLESVFASRVPDVERYKALQLTLHLLTIGGTSWLYSDRKDIVFELIVQTLRVEIGVLMLDAIAPHAVIGQLQTLTISRASDAHCASEGIQTDQVSFPKSANIVECIDDHLGVRDSDGDGARCAGDRALQNLPLCLILFEHMVEALSSILSENKILLSDDVIQRVFDALTEIAELELQFLEQTMVHDTSTQDGMSQLLGIIWGTFCTFAAQNPFQFSERIMYILPDVFKHMPLPETRHVIPVLYGIVVSDHSDMKSHIESLVQPDVFIPLGHVLTSIKLDRSNISSRDEEGNMMIVMLQEILLKLLRIFLSEDWMPLPASQLCESLPQLQDIEDILATISIENEVEAVDIELIASCLGMAARVYLLSNKQETILQGLLTKYTHKILEETILAEDQFFFESSLYREVFFVLKELCSNEASGFGSLPIGPSETPLAEIVHMMD